MKKERIIDTRSIYGVREETDTTWELFANSLEPCFGSFSSSKPDALRKIYCEQRLRNYDNLMVPSIIYNIPPAFFNKDILFGSNKDELAKKLMEKELTNWAPTEHSPFILLGYIGTGKSTFIDYFFNIYVPPNDKVYAAICNLFRTSTDRNMFIYKVLSSIDKRLNEICPSLKLITRENLELMFSEEVINIKATLHSSEIQTNKLDEFFSPFTTCETNKDIGTYRILIRKKLQYLRHKGMIKQLWLVLDNLDQHYYYLETASFIESLSLSEEFDVPLIIPMRYISLATSVAREAYDSYQPRKMSLSLPDPSGLITKRINLFREYHSQLLNEPIKVFGGTRLLKDYLDDVEKSVDTLIKSNIFGDIILPLSNYNMRQLLEIVLISLQSHYFYFDYFTKNRDSINDKNVLRRFLQSQLLHNGDYFDPHGPVDEQAIINIYENEDKDCPYNNTIRLRILQSIDHLGDSVSLKKFYNYLTQVFDYRIEDIASCINTFIKGHVFSIQDNEKTGMSQEIREGVLKEEHLKSSQLHISKSYSGYAHVILAEKLEYIDVIKYSTYLPVSIVNDVQGEDRRSFRKRMAANDLFLQYIMHQENEEIRTVVKNAQLFDQNFQRLSVTMISRVRDLIVKITDG